LSRDTRESPVLIIGGGLAGLFCALKLAPLPCTILNPAPLGEGAASAWAQGGIAAAIGPGDSPDAHVADTLAAGAGLCDAARVAGMVLEANARIEDLLRYGVPFDRGIDGALLRSREAAHSEARILRVSGDRAGAAIMAALIAHVRASPSIRVIEGATALRLEIRDGRIEGVDAALEGRGITFYAPHVVLATGGLGALYATTTNPALARGSGISLALMAGAQIMDCEFVQFHPTALDVAEDPAPLATEALRGEGATLIDAKGARFMPALHPDAELGPRDIVARGVFAASRAGGAFLDCRAAIGPGFATRFPYVHARAIAAGIDPATQPIPIVPAAHYHMGGVMTDAMARVPGIAGLYAIGEVAASGVHGANRLASNSLLEAVVFAARAADEIAGRSSIEPLRSRAREVSLSTDAADPEAFRRLRRLMSETLGVIRDAAGLARARSELARLQARAGGLRAELQVASLIAAAADARCESRGAHFRSDYPGRQDPPCHTIQRIDRSGGIDTRLVPPGTEALP
jgi:L-aspartate oxidase